MSEGDFVMFMVGIAILAIWAIGKDKDLSGD